MLGKKVKDKITGFVGIATARVEYINGCVQYEITPLVKDGDMRKSYWLDEQRLKKSEKKKQTNTIEKSEMKPSQKRGGPGNHPGSNTPMPSVCHD